VELNPNLFTTRIRRLWTCSKAYVVNWFSLLISFDLTDSLLNFYVLQAKTVYEDKASDYEDVWSPPQYGEKGQHMAPRLSTFKPDVIASSVIMDNTSHHQSHGKLSPPQNPEDMRVHSRNTQNQRLSYKGTTRAMVNKNQGDGVKMSLGRTPDNRNNRSKENLQDNNNRNVSGKSPNGLYSEPVDAINFRRFATNRHSEPSIRWSQPVLSLPKVDFGGTISEDEYRVETVGTGKGKTSVACSNIRENNEKMGPVERNNANLVTRGSSLANVNNNNGEGRGSSHKGLVCASMDNLCHLGRKAKKLSCGAEQSDEDEKMTPTNDEECKVFHKSEEKVVSPRKFFCHFHSFGIVTRGVCRKQKRLWNFRFLFAAFSLLCYKSRSVKNDFIPSKVVSNAGEIPM